MKTHLSLATTNLSRSVDFYATLLDVRPTKLLGDYALFVTEQPALELALDLVESPPRLNDDHYGIFVETTDEVERAIERLEGAGLASSIERQQTCCYANQTKVWATDPSGRPWEIYTVHEEAVEHDSSDSTCC